MTHLKRNYILLLLLLFATNAFAQSSIVTFVKAVPRRSFNNTKDSVISYPIFRFKDKILTDNINRLVKAEFFDFYDQKQNVTIKKALKELAEDGLSELTYEELLNDNKFFSFCLFQEWIAAYPSYTTTFYAFDKETKQRITIDELIQPAKSVAFKSFITSLWKDSISKYRQDLKMQLANKEIDSVDYSTAIEYTETNCLESYSTKDFKLSKDTLEIFFDCGFPRILRPLDPSGGVLIPFKQITEYLRPRYRR